MKFYIYCAIIGGKKSYFEHFATYNGLTTVEFQQKRYVMKMVCIP